MPNHRSAEKRDRQNARRQAVNMANRSRLRTQVKKLRSAISAKEGETAQNLLSETVAALDKAVQKGILHRNAAARHKARLTLHVNALAAKR
jgi:small subunit ribosomal protein S20